MHSDGCLPGGCLCGALAEQVETAETTGKPVEADYRVAGEDAEREYLHGLFGLPVMPISFLAWMAGLMVVYTILAQVLKVIYIRINKEWV